MPSRFNLSRWALEHQSLVRYLIVMLLLGGLVSYFRLGQDEDPPFTFRAMALVTHWPGASSLQMTEQVTDKIEQTLQDIPYMDKINSYAKPGETVSIIMLRQDTPPKEVPGVWQKVRNKVGEQVPNLPAGVIGPMFKDDFGDTYGVIYAISGDGQSYRDLKVYADMMRQELLRIPDVAKVVYFGEQTEKIYIDISNDRLTNLGVGVADIQQQINQQNTVMPSGVIALEKNNIQIRVTGEIKDVEALSTLPIHTPNGTIQLKDVAHVYRAYTDPPLSKMRVGDANRVNEVVALGVSMVSGGDIVRLGQQLDALQAELIRDLPLGIEIHKVSDQPQAVVSSVNEFVRVLIEAIVIVLAVSFISLGLHTKPLRIDVRPGLVVALTIPLVLAATFLCMYFFNINLHKISLGALIIALGLLVDDAIIAVEMMVRKMEEGYDRLTAASYMYQTTAFPMLTGTLITVAGFLPIALAKSMAGEYTFSIFAVTAIALVISWIAAVVFTPYLGFLLLKVKAKTSHAEFGVFDTPFYRFLRRLVDRCVAHRWVVIGLTVLALVGGVFSFKFIEKQFFPDSNRVELLVDLWLPEGSSYQATEAQAIKLEHWLQQQPGLASFVTYVGVGSPRFYLPLDQQLAQLNLAQFVLTPKSLADRERLKHDLNELFKHDFLDLRTRVKYLPSGPPVAYPVQFRIEGPHPDQVRIIADRVKEVMMRNTSAVGVNDNWNENIKVLRVDVNQEQARALGVSSFTIQQSLQMLLDGAPIAQLREDNKLIDIVIRQPTDLSRHVAALNNATIPVGGGKFVPLQQLANIAVVWEPGVVWRYNRDFAITVQSDVVDGIQGPTVTDQINQELGTIREALPPGYRILVAGATEESAQAEQSIQANLPLMLFVVMTLLVIQLNSVARATMVYLTGPLGIIGAALALLVLGSPFGFVAQLGVIALLGMIIRNSVILVDQIERHKHDGQDPWSAIVNAAVSRARPIMLTAAAAVLAMIPLSRSIFWGPMAVAIMGGLIIATLLTLLFLPALYAACFRVKRLTKAS